MTVRSAAPGVLPGADFRHATALLESEITTPHLGSLPELPDRGHHGSLLGRAAGQLSELYTELTSYGWRLVARPGADHQRASALLSSDVDTLAEVRGERAEQGRLPGALQLELLGPVSLAAQLHLPSGEKVLIDHGARRDLAASLALGAASHLQHVLRSVRPEALTVTVLEPQYRRVRTGGVPTVSGYQTIRALPRDETRQLLGSFIAVLREAGADEVILDLGDTAQPEHIEDFHARSATRADGFALPVHRAQAADWERTAELVESGARVLVSLLRPDEPAQRTLPEVSQLAARLAQPWQELGMPASSLAAFVLTPYGARHRHQMAGLREAGALRTLNRLHETAEALTEQSVA